MAFPVDIQSLEDHRLSESLIRFEGQQQIPLSVFVAEFADGDGPPLHTHPYAELFLVERGPVLFTVGQEKIEVKAGNVVTVAANTEHKFQGASEERCRVISAHPAGEVSQHNISSISWR
jgi:quercetin dioxygenase-like cupin family protein